MYDFRLPVALLASFRRLSSINQYLGKQSKLIIKLVHQSTADINTTVLENQSNVIS
jgi:hypothetical protein